MSSSDDVTFSGLWQPASTVQTLSDELLYKKIGGFLRYLPVQTNLVVQLTETPFYIQNIQEPIARRTEIIFHNILFTIVVLELFGLIFLLFKLLFFPLIDLVYRQFSRNQVGLFDEEERSEQSEKQCLPDAFVATKQKNEPRKFSKNLMIELSNRRMPI